MNSTDTVSLATDIHDGPTITDVVSAAGILGLKPSELIGALEPLLLERWKQQRTLRRNPDVTAELAERDA